MKKLSGFLPDMEIKISNNPQKSINLFYGLNGYKRTLKNTIQKIKSVEETKKGTRIFIVPPSGCKYNHISFHPDDIIICMQSIKMKPEIFDPNNLV